MKIYRLSLLFATVFLFLCGARAQQDVLMSQYMHNQFAINPAFAGSREGLTAFASFRKQWMGVDNSPRSILFTTHTPLRTNSVAIGLSVVNQSILETGITAAQATIAYRIDVGSNGNTLAFGIQPGMKMVKTDWTNMKVYDFDKQDDVFAENESFINPTVGVGISLYGDNYFLGVSTQSLMVSDEFNKEAEFAPGDATYYATAGVEFELGEVMTLQPSIMVQHTKRYGNDIDFTLTPGWNRMLYVELGYRTTGVMLGGISFRPPKASQLNVSYTYERTTGDFSGYNSGSHEISISYDFVYRVKNVGPRFF